MAVSSQPVSFPPGAASTVEFNNDTRSSSPASKQRH